MPTPARRATAATGAPGSARNTARAASRIASSLRAARAWRALSAMAQRYGNGSLRSSKGSSRRTKRPQPQSGSGRPMWDRPLNEILNGAFRSVPRPKGVPVSPKARWIAFSAALAATLMDLLDSTIASVAGPSIRADLGGSYSSLQWIAAAYTLAMSVGLLTGGGPRGQFRRHPGAPAAARGRPP